MNALDLIDLRRYPLDDLEGETAASLARDVRDSLAATGACSLEGFLLPEALDAMRAQARTLIPMGYQGPAEATPILLRL